jgi:hypothetical protein
VSFRFVKLGALDLAIVGCEHGFPCDLGLETTGIPSLGGVCVVWFSL